jgi:hypothetical protein
MVPEISIPRLYFMIMEKSDSTRMSNRAFNHEYGSWASEPKARTYSLVLKIDILSNQ